MACVRSFIYKLYGCICPKNTKEGVSQQELSSSTDKLTRSVAPEPLSTPHDPNTPQLVITGYTLPIEKVAEEITVRAAQNKEIMSWNLLGMDEGVPHDQAFDYIAFKLEHHLGVNFTNEHFEQIVASIGRDSTWVIHKNDGKHFLISIRAYHNAAFDFSIGTCNII